jgi:hypothetical protein
LVKIPGNSYLVRCFFDVRKHCTFPAIIKKTNGISVAFQHNFLHAHIPGLYHRTVFLNSVKVIEQHPVPFEKIMPVTAIITRAEKANQDDDNRKFIHGAKIENSWIMSAAYYSI